MKIVDKKVGGNHSGSWIHPDLAIHLAQWLSREFAVQVSKWVGEWRDTSADNERRFRGALAEIQPSPGTRREAAISDRLEVELCAEAEVKTPSGYIDLVTDAFIIEIKEYSKWKHAVGQIICYGIYYPDKQKKIILFGGDSQLDNIILDTCASLAIELEILD